MGQFATALVERLQRRRAEWLVTRVSAPILFAKLVECRTAKQTTVIAKLVWAYRGDRIHARRRVNNLAFSCGGEARRRDIKVIRAASQKPPDHVFKMIAPASALVTKEDVTDALWQLTFRRVWGRPVQVGR